MGAGTRGGVVRRRGVERGVGKGKKELTFTPEAIGNWILWEAVGGEWCGVGFWGVNWVDEGRETGEGRFSEMRVAPRWRWIAVAFG